MIQENLSNEDNNFCIIKESQGNTVVFYPYRYLEWDKSSAFLSKELNAAVFSFHIHDGDLWMYVLYYNGEIVDQFNPIPDYWDDNASLEEIDSWKGSAEIIVKFVPNLRSEAIRKYLVRWDLEKEGQKAYEDDQFINEDWQLTDFMNKIGFTYPLDEGGNPLGAVFRLWTGELKSDSEQPSLKKWWKFW